MRHEPLGVGRVAVEAAAELVADAPVRHRIERSPGDRQRPGVVGRDEAPEQELDRHRLRELRGAPPTAVAGVERRLDPGRRRFEQRRGRVRGDGGHAVLRDERLDQALPGAFDLAALLTPRPVDALQHLDEGRHAVARFVREVRAAVEGLTVRRQEHGHRPAATAGHGLDRGHVDLVEVRPLLAVDLDGDEAAVQVGRGHRVLERLALHDVAPVTGRVADAQEDRPVEQLRPGERVRTPRKPVHGVVRVLEQVRARLACEAVGHRSMVRAARGMRAARRGGLEPGGADPGRDRPAVWVIRPGRGVLSTLGPPRGVNNSEITTHGYGRRAMSWVTLAMPSNRGRANLS